MQREGDHRNRPNTSLRERQKAFTRQALLQAARAEFVARGYLGTSVEKIVERAGASRATFYIHFTNKWQLLAEIYAELRPEAVALYGQLDAVLTEGSEEDLRHWLEDAVEWMEQHGWLLAAWEQALTLEPELAALSNEETLSLADLLPGYLSRCPRERRKEARLRVVLLSEQLAGYMNRFRFTGLSDKQRKFLIDVLTDIWSQTLGALETGDGARRAEPDRRPSTGLLPSSRPRPAKRPSR